MFWLDAGFVQPERKGTVELKQGMKIYVGSSFYISRGSDDFVGGIATVSRVYDSFSGGKTCTFVEIKERPGTGYNWSRYLEPMQDDLKKEFGDKTAHADPGIDTPWIEPGDIVNGQIYKGDPIW